MSDKRKNPPAFPFAENGQPYGNYHGMTLRDYFAAAALQGVMAHKSVESAMAADTAYHLADAMLKARENE